MKLLRSSILFIGSNDDLLFNNNNKRNESWFIDVA